jgi:hypothetical protein
LVVVLGAGLLACGGSSSSTTTPPPPPPPTTGSLQLTNATSVSIAQVYVSLTTSSSWGPVQNSAPIAPGATWTLGSIPPNSYDAMAVVFGSVGTYFSYSMGFPIVAGVTRTATIPTLSFTGSLLVTNGLRSDITGLYAVPTGLSPWSPNLLTLPIPPGGSFTLDDIDAGLWDFQCVHADGSTNTATSVLISSLSYTPVVCN